MTAYFPARPSVHLWIYNHPLSGISDQIDFFCAIMQQYGYKPSVGRNPRHDALNVVIENFSDATSDILRKYCRESGKRVCVIMTEHIDFIDNEIYIHGDMMWNQNDYMHPATQVSRIRSLMDCAPYIRGFFVLGDLPELLNMGMMLPGITVRTLPFPQLSPPSDHAEWAELPADLVFTGAVTRFRVEILEITRTKLTVHNPDGFLSRKARDRFSRSGRLVLNIPQRTDWKWLSLMRVMAALRCGRATVSLGTRDRSEIAKCCIQIDIKNRDFLAELQDMVSRSGELFKKSFDNYHAMAADFQLTHIFPDDFLDYWAITEL